MIEERVSPEALSLSNTSSIPAHINCRAERMKAQEALAAGVVSALEDDYETLVRLAVARVKELKGTLPLAQPSMAGIDLDAIRAQATVPEGANLSHEVVKIIAEAIVAGAKASDLAGALDIGYLAFGLVACTAAAREGRVVVAEAKLKSPFSSAE